MHDHAIGARQPEETSGPVARSAPDRALFEVETAAVPD